jgi:aminoglycoside/choline kinase family phosphotransferase
MNAIDTQQVKSQSYYEFLFRTFQSEEFAVFALAGDASSRKYYRVVFENQSSVLMQWEPFVDDEKYPFLSVLNHFKRNNVQVPQVMAKSAREGFVLLEDLGDLTLERKFWENQNQEVSMPYYRLAIDELLKMHYPSTFDRTQDCTAFHIAFDVEKLLWELNYARTHVIEKFSNIQVNQNESAMLDRTFNQICTRLDKEPKYVAHRDYHSRNLMLKFEKMRVIDFQDARMGAIQYDLVSLLRDSYVNLNEATSSELINYYLENRKQYATLGEIKSFSKEHFMNIYELQTVQRCFKACGSFTSFYNARKDLRYLRYISKTMAQVKKSLEMFPEYSDFRNYLNEQGLFEKNFEIV